MVSKAALSRLQVLVWVAIYGGLLGIVVGSFVSDSDPALANWMYVVGGLLVVAGVILIYVRSRLHESP